MLYPRTKGVVLTEWTPEQLSGKSVGFYLRRGKPMGSTGIGKFYVLGGMAAAMVFILPKRYVGNIPKLISLTQPEVDSIKRVLVDPSLDFVCVAQTLSKWVRGGPPPSLSQSYGR